MADAALSLSLLVESTGLQNAGYTGKNLEIRCDLTVTENLSQKEQLSYLGTIVKTLKNAQKKKEAAVFYTESIWQIKWRRG